MCIGLKISLRQKSGNPNATITDYFDVDVGTNTRGILKSMVFSKDGTDHPMFKAIDTLNFLADKGKNIFIPSGFLSRLNGLTPTYSTKSLEHLLKACFLRPDDKYLMLKDTLNLVLIPCYDLSSTELFLFSRVDTLETENYGFHMCEVCCATAAMLGFFTSISMTSIDGKMACTIVNSGEMMNNPVATSITHVLHNKQEFPFVNGVDDLLMLSGIYRDMCTQGNPFLRSAIFNTCALVNKGFRC